MPESAVFVGIDVSKDALDVALGPGVTAFIGRNGQGKTNLVEALGYLASLSSHRVATEKTLQNDPGLVRAFLAATSAGYRAAAADPAADFELEALECNAVWS